MFDHFGCIVKYSGCSLHHKSIVQNYIQRIIKTFRLRFKWLVQLPGRLAMPCRQLSATGEGSFRCGRAAWDESPPGGQMSDVKVEWCDWCDIRLLRLLRATRPRAFETWNSDELSQHNMDNMLTDTHTFADTHTHICRCIYRCDIRYIIYIILYDYVYIKVQIWYALHSVTAAAGLSCFAFVAPYLVCFRAFEALRQCTF